jgi:hypothetical protein
MSLTVPSAAHSMFCGFRSWWRQLDACNKLARKKVLTWHKGANTRGIRWKSGRALSTSYWGYSRALEGALGVTRSGYSRGTLEVLGVLDGRASNTRYWGYSGYSMDVPRTRGTPREPLDAARPIAGDWRSQCTGRQTHRQTPRSDAPRHAHTHAPTHPHTVTHTHTHANNARTCTHTHSRTR